MRRLPWVAGALIAAAAIAFGPALPGPFDFDDGPAIVHNATIRPGATALDLLRTPPLGTAASGRPVVNASFALNGALNRKLSVGLPDGLSAPSAAVGFRITNILLHALAGMLLLFVVEMALANGSVPAALRDRSRLIAILVAALWLVHPLQTEAVNYVSQRTEILASIFYLAATAAAMRYLLGVDGKAAVHRGRWLAATATAMVLGAGSKEIVVTAPLLIAALDIALFGTAPGSLFGAPQRRRLYLILLAVAALSVVPDLLGARAGTVGTDRGITPLDYLLTQGWAIPHYLRLAVAPIGLVYDYGQTPVIGAASWAGLAVLVITVSLILALWRSPRWRPLALLGTCFFLLLAPSSSVMPINTEIAAERRMYLALAVVILGIVCGVVLLVEHMAERARVAVGLVAGLAIAAFGLLSAQRSALYKEPLLLWTDAMQRFPTNARAYDNVGAALLRADWNNAPRADSLFVRAIALDSTFLEPWRRRASIAVRAGRYEQAESFLTRMLAIAPADSDATATLGKVYLITDRPRLAIPILERMAATSRDSTTLANLQSAYLLTARDDQAAGRFAQASEWLTRALRIDERDPEAWTRLAMTRAELGDRASALDAVRRALRMDPSYSPALQVLDVLERSR